MLDVEADYDYVYLRTALGAEIGELTGSSAPSDPIYGDDGTIWVRLSSDSSVNGAGFAAAFTCVSLADLPPPPPPCTPISGDAVTGDLGMCGRNPCTCAQVTDYCSNAAVQSSCLATCTDGGSPSCASPILATKEARASKYRASISQCVLAICRHPWLRPRVVDRSAGHQLLHGRLQRGNRCGLHVYSHQFGRRLCRRLRLMPKHQHRSGRVRLRDCAGCYLQCMYSSRGRLGGLERGQLDHQLLRGRLHWS